jgi:hypothetical protein
MMMKLKWLFGALLLANLGLWMWASWYREAPAPEDRGARAPIAPQKLRRLAEPGVKLVPRKVPPPLNAELASSAPQICFRVGPFPDADAAAGAESKLGALQLASVRRAEEIKLISGYRVSLPAFSSKAAAERERRRLTQLGIKDHALIQDGATRYLVSLGLFAVEANAQGRVHELAAKGVTARIEPMEQTRTRYWLDINVPVPPDTAAKIKQLFSETKAVQVQEAACPAVAPGNPPPAQQPSGSAPRARLFDRQGILTVASATIRARIAQWVEHLICNQAVGGSNPSAGSIFSTTYEQFRDNRHGLASSLASFAVGGRGSPVGVCPLLLQLPLGVRGCGER